MPVRRVLLLAAPALLMLGLPVLIAGLAVGRLVFVPLAPHTRFVGFDGLRANGGCLDSANGVLVGRVWQCVWDVHLDSQLEILGHDPVAVDWCTELASEGYDRNQRTAQVGAARLGFVPLAWGGWAGCDHFIPLALGFSFELTIKH